ncbi:type II toxin-antitoxin system RelE/ParE family toxin [Fulvivirga imtechensis]|uniref:type II toxin-antitoxin system RelE/ParE family toxin n=1 Tax=Fulvivirga imtechensis TaxID=881893 RepID=UPI0012F74A9B
MKKYPSLRTELKELGDKLAEEPTFGTSIGNNCYKIRLAIASKGKGKSGGARVITYVYVTGETVFLLSIYDKSNKENITDKELLDLLKKIE